MVVSRYIIWGDGTGLDHYPIQITLDLEAGQHCQTKWKMNSAHLSEALHELQQVWRSQPPQASFFSKIRAIVHYYKIFCQNKAKEFRTIEEQVRQQLHKATVDLHRNLYDLPSQESQGALANQVRDIEDRVAAGKRIHNRIK
jgi:hypothetical protein